MEELESLLRKWPVGKEFRDCENCPEMVVVPAGSFMMGSKKGDDDEKPVHRVTIGRPFAVGVYEVTRGEFGRFVEETGYSTGDECYTYESEGFFGDPELKERSGRGWKNPGFEHEQGETEPVVCVSWDDAQAYVRWLSEQTGEAYRLLSEAEWEYAARAGTTTAWYWGESDAGQCRYANGGDQTAKSHHDGWTVAACDDGHYQTAPGGGMRRMRLGCTMCWGTCGSGRRTVGIRVMWVPRVMGARGREGSVHGACCGAAPGSTYPGTSVPRFASGTPPGTGTSIAASVWLGRSRRES